MNLSINRLQHIGIPVRNLDIAEAFYTRLGFNNVMNGSIEDKGEKGLVAMMKLKHIIIELYQLPERELGAVSNRKDGHIDHIAFDVDDIEDTFAQLKAGAFNIIEDAPVFLPFWNNGCRYFNITGPDGERLEFNQIL
jgi:catechol 2,3-dioxygenase-like lactoylglutathione lyase family enzyme